MGRNGSQGKGNSKSGRSRNASGGSSSGNGASSSGSNGGNKIPAKLAPLLGKLSPQQLAVVTALLTNALSVDSILIDKDQNIQIILAGSFRRKTRMEHLLREISDFSISDLLDAISKWD
ncbi:hypothetical protein [Paenibacillus sp. MBLB4367]|uniref:hypothetical protein n=1 Tax=Paenibacillus sp. MBLB4367 TaxID=3384767 RepID=UPI003907FF44